MAPLIIDEDPDGSGEYVVESATIATGTEWATVASIADVTGVTVTDRDRKTATAIIEDLIGLIEAVGRSDMTDRDRHYLGHAVAWQSVWVKDNPDLFSRIDVTSASQDGESMTVRNVDAHLLAPLARKSIRRLSWRQPTRQNDRLPLAGRVNVLSEEYDDSLPWRPA